MFPLSVIDFEPSETTKTSHAEITLKSATLPRRKPTKMEIQVEIKPKVSVVDQTNFILCSQHLFSHDKGWFSKIFNWSSTSSAWFTKRSHSRAPADNVYFIYITKPLDELGTSSERACCAYSKATSISKDSNIKLIPVCRAKNCFWKINLW